MNCFLLLLPLLVLSWRIDEVPDLKRLQTELQQVGSIAPDANLDFSHLCQSKNYTVQSYWVATTDGYILNMFRIGGKNTGSLNTQGIPVLLQHGLIDSSDTWIINSESLAPGFILANQGYDVWFGNSRGNKHSRNHTVLDPDSDTEFWDFSWQDMADFDVPAQVNFVLETTGRKKIVYMGHSQGTTQMFAHLSDHVEFGSKLYLAVMLAPVGSVKHQTSDLLRLMANSEFLSVLSWFGADEVLPATQSTFMYYVCYFLNWLCRGGLFLISDADPSFDNPPQLPVIMTHFPAGTSLKDLEHWTQMTLASTSVVQRFNYSTAQLNLDHYGQTTPPVFNLSKISANIGLFDGYADRLADPADVVWLAQQLPASSLVWYRDDYPCGHVTYLWGTNMTYFNDVLSLIAKYAGN